MKIVSECSDAEQRRIRRIESLVTCRLPELYDKVDALVDGLVANGFEPRKSGAYVEVLDPDRYTDRVALIFYVEADLDRKGKYLLLHGIIDRGIMSSQMLKAGTLAEIQGYVKEKVQLVERCRANLISLLVRRTD